MQEIARSTPEEIDAQRTAPYWNDVVDAAHVWLRHLEAGVDYEFDPDRFASLTTPTLLLTGSESPPNLQDATAIVDEALPNSHVVTFEGHAHEAMLTAPDRFIELVLRFIDDPNADSRHPA
ncbi:alpha/beta fold hydrolase [Salinadaptatus halalkaliphilus]|uniref:alpha/beta fold hydrolase n=1 Tax=Salinadaptatus halalkaliphilus TaxID=2419781 RepID=UPI001FE80EB0|nr:hypothetical protein [Salinadaptatus halalkaliphilus]